MTVCVARRLTSGSAGFARKPGQEVLHFFVFLARRTAGALVALIALTAVLVVAALDFADTLFAPPELASALLIGFGLAGGRPIGGLGGDAHRCGDDADRCLRKTTGQGQHGQRGEQEGRALHARIAAMRALARQ